jgi:hephaestin
LQTREYFIAAEEVVWDYAPFNGEMCGGTLVPFSDNAKTFVEPGPDKVGRKYVKALYVEYTDATFKEKKVNRTRDAADLWTDQTLHNALIGSRVAGVLD